MEKQIIEKVKVSAVCDQDSPKFERMEGKEQHCYTSITKTCQTQRTSRETSTYPSFPNCKLFIFQTLFGNCQFGNYLKLFGNCQFGNFPKLFGNCHFGNFQTLFRNCPQDHIRCGISTFVSTHRASFQSAPAQQIFSLQPIIILHNHSLASKNQMVACLRGGFGFCLECESQLY